MASVVDKFAVAEPHVYVGIWTRWSQGSVLGSTLTLTETNGSFLVAFLALFVSFVGTSFFRISCFVIHHILSEKTAQDDIYHQRQAILRNSASGTHAAAALMSMMWSHREKRPWKREAQGRLRVGRKRVFRRLLPLLIHTTITLTLVSIAGIFSSRITGMTGDEVLVIRNAGSQPQNSNFTNKEEIGLGRPYRSRRVQESAQYAQNCYVDQEKSSGPNCRKFVKQQLKREIDRNATCPFSDELCKMSHGNIRIDTGYIDSNRDLGVNLPDEDGMRLRHVFHCAPLTTQNRTQQENITDWNIQNLTIPYMTYNYGSTLFPDGEFHNYSFAEPMTSDAEINGRYRISYKIYPSTEAPSRATIYWRPEEGLKSNNSDLYILFLTPRGLYYTDRVDDPWFSAQNIGKSIEQPTDNGEWITTSWYKPDEVSAPMGCASSIQMCFPPYSDTSKCTPLQGMLGYMDAQSRLPSGLSPAQANRSSVYWERMDRTTVILAALNALGGEILKAKYTLDGSSQVQLPDDQWQEEVINWSAIMLAALQGIFIDEANGPANEQLSNFFWSPVDGENRRVLDNMIIRSSAHANFSVLGLCIMLIVGAFILLTETLLEFLYVRFVWKGRHFHQYQRLEWCLNGTLQLQRLAHESTGHGPWENCDDEIPILQHGKLATLNLEDPKHPVFHEKNSSPVESSGESKFDDDYSTKHSYGEKSSPTVRQESIPSCSARRSIASLNLLLRRGKSENFTKNGISSVSNLLAISYILTV